MILLTRLIAASFLIAILPSTASAQTMTSLFQFSEASDTENWQIVNDGVKHRPLSWIRVIVPAPA
jgi:hypothetical protein